MKKTKNLILILVLLAVCGTGAFYGGVLYSSGKQNGRTSQLRPNAQFPPNGFIANGQFQRGDRAVSSEGISGEIISKDEDSITIKQIDGSTKIVFYSNSTNISKNTKGAIEDLFEGKQVMVGGSEQNGAFIAKSIQLRPESPVLVPADN